MPTSKQIAAYDARGTSSTPSTNYGSYTNLLVNSGSPTRRSYLYWSLPFPIGASIVSAKLRVYEKARATGGTRTITAELLAAKFSESTLTYANAPGVVPAGPTGTLAQGNATTDGRVWEIDVTDLLQDVSDDTPWFGIRLSSSISTMLELHSSESTTALRPTLEIAWADSPQVPVGLSPAGGRAVSVARPLHRFQFIDDPSDSLTAFQLQWAAAGATFDPVTGFSATDLDTGVVVSTLPQWTPTTDTAAGATRTWTVRTRDTAGLWSPYAPPTTWTRTAKGTLTVTSPAASPSDFVTESTPPLGWSTSGMTQKNWQVFILDHATGQVLHDSKKRDGTETAYTPPAGILKSATRVYRVVVRVWDDVARESIPGDSAYVEASRAFTLNPTGTGPVTDLVAVVVEDSPEVQFAWTHPTTPDFWQLRVGEEFVGNPIEGTSLLTAGTSYAMSWWGAPPKTDLEVEMVPITNGEATPGNNVVDVRTEPTGIWLSGVDGEDAICIYTDGAIGRWQPGQVSSVHRAVNSRYSVVRRQALGSKMCSQAGTVQGAEQGETAERLRDGGGLMRLVLTNTNVIGTVDQMQVDPELEFNMGIPVSFDFYEQPTGP